MIVVLMITLAFAGCASKATPQATEGTAPATSDPSSGNSAPASAAGSTCPSVDAAHSWNGKWDSKANQDRCFDMRELFYSPSADNPDPWNKGTAGDMDFPVTFTQTGCDVSGSIVVGEKGTIAAPHGCPISLTGKVDKDNVLSGTWKAYCDIEFVSESISKEDSGIFTLWMEPGGTTFAGTFQGNSADIKKMVAESCPTQNGNWVGKRM